MLLVNVCCVLLLAACILASQDVFRITLSTPTDKPAITRLGDINNMYYTVPVQIGNQKFDLLLDTGSSTIWVTSTLCRTIACAKHSKYDRTLSPTYRGTYYRPFHMEYADNSKETAVYSVDAIKVAGLTVKRQFFGEAGYSGQGDDVDGIFGMGPDSQVVPAGILKPLTFLTNLQRDGVIKSRVFSLRLTGGNDSVMTIGGTDESLYTGSVTYAPVDTNFNSWTVTADTISYGGVDVCDSCPVIMDSGTSVIVIPTPYTRFLQYIPDIGQNNNQYYVPCSRINALPNLNFVISGVTFTMTPRDYVKYNYGVYYCRLHFVIKDLDQWILGDPFLRKYYTVYDADKNQIGIALSSKRS